MQALLKSRLDQLQQSIEGLNDRTSYGVIVVCGLILIQIGMTMFDASKEAEQTRLQTMSRLAVANVGVGVDEWQAREAEARQAASASDAFLWVAETNGLVSAEVENRLRMLGDTLEGMSRLQIEVDPNPIEIGTSAYLKGLRLTLTGRSTSKDVGAEFLSQLNELSPILIIDEVMISTSGKDGLMVEVSAIAPLGKMPE
ncbi:MAG: hypothetical protein AAF668_02775 [Pseudomonadota bacterium]